MIFPFAPPSHKPKLEILRRLPELDDGRTPLLFIHGSFISAWCWDEFFLPYFSARGFPAYAVSLRGHGGSEGLENLPWYSLSDYVDDVEQVIDKLDQPPVLIGHSMGGMIIQKYLQRGHEVPAVVLLASVPPQGLLGMAGYAAVTRPWLLQEINLVQLGLKQFANYREVCQALFSKRLALDKAYHYLQRTQAESQRVMWDMSGYDLPLLSGLQLPPALILGAHDDALVPEFAIHATAQAFAVDAELFSNMAHIMMLEPDWERLAKRVLVWLDDQNL